MPEINAPQPKQGEADLLPSISQNDNLASQNSFIFYFSLILLSSSLFYVHSVISLYLSMKDIFCLIYSQCLNYLFQFFRAGPHI